MFSFKKSTVNSILLLTLFSQSLLAKNDVSPNNKKQTQLILYALEFEGITQKNKKGAFDFLLQDLSSLSKIRHEYKILPTGRGAKLFYNDKQSCAIPSSTYPGYYIGYDVIHSEIISTVDYISFTTPDSAQISSKEALEGNVIGVIRDEDAWDYAARFNLANVTYYKTNDLASLVHMLYKNRIDVAIHDANDFLNLAKNLGYPTPTYDSDFLIAQDGIAITCHNTAFNRRYISLINPHLKYLIKHSLHGYFVKAATIN